MPTSIFLFGGCTVIEAGVPAVVTFVLLPVYAVVKPVTLPSVPYPVP